MKILKQILQNKPMKDFNTPANSKYSNYELSENIQPWWLSGIMNNKFK